MGGWIWNSFIHSFCILFPPAFHLVSPDICGHYAFLFANLLMEVYIFYAFVLCLAGFFLSFFCGIRHNETTGIYHQKGVIFTSSSLSFLFFFLFLSLLFYVVPHTSFVKYYAQLNDLWLSYSVLFA